MKVTVASNAEHSFAFFRLYCSTNRGPSLFFSAPDAPRKNTPAICMCVRGSAVQRTNDQACGCEIQPSRIKPQMQR